MACLSKDRAKLILSLFFLLPISLLAQFTIKGTVKDKKTGETIIGAAVQVKGKSIGVSTDINGNWELKLQGEPPVTLMCTYLGYKPLEITATRKDENLLIRLETEDQLMKEVKVVGERVAQKLKESPVTIERMGIQEIKQTASVGFYEGLSNLKGVDMTSASLGFKIINTRGFNSTSPVRTLQIIDGVDNQAPGLNFSLGNFVGASEIDVEKVDIVVGANSATYGPNAFNGVINIQTKDPFKYEGLDVQLKGGQRDLFEGAIRYAHVSRELKEDKYDDGYYKAFAKFNNKVLKDRFAYKLNASYLSAFDWQAVNYEPTVNSFNPVNDAAGYDGVNVYGESQFPTFTKKYLPFELGITDPNTPVPSYFRYEDFEGIRAPVLYLYRTGYKEENLTNYNTYSLKLQGALFYKIPKIGTLSYNYNYGNGTTVYQGDNRYSIKDITFIQQKLELKGDRFFVRTYETTEDAGNSYDLVFTAYKLLESRKSFPGWYSDFDDGFKKAGDRGITDLDQKIRFARTFADTANTLNGKSMLVPGTQAFTDEFNKVTSNPSFQSGGTKFQDASSLRHIEGQYNFDLTKISIFLPSEFKIGGNYRLFSPNSFGTIFTDTLIDRNDISKGFTKISTSEYGFYVNTEKDLYKDKIKLIASLRYDDHANFKAFYTPALSTVIKIRETDNIRLTYTTASRNPTLQDQYLLYDIGVAKLRGNLNGYTLILPENYFGDSGYIANSAENYRPTKVSGVRPERVRSFEVGYKGIVFRNIYVDASYYYSLYNSFLGYIVGFVNTGNDSIRNVEARPTRVSANSNSVVTTQGFSIGLNYYFDRYFFTGVNYTYSELLKRDNTDPLIPFFNTPKHKANFNFGGKDINNFGFNVSYKYVDGFDYFGSPQFTGPVRSYGLVDAQVNYTFPKFGTVLKLGASNILDNRHIEAYGAPVIGRLAYFSVNYQFKNARKENNN